MSVSLRVPATKWALFIERPLPYCIEAGIRSVDEREEWRVLSVGLYMEWRGFGFGSAYYDGPWSWLDLGFVSVFFGGRKLPWVRRGES